MQIGYNRCPLLYEDPSCRMTRTHRSYQELQSLVHHYVFQYTEQPDHASETIHQENELNSPEAHYRTEMILET